MPYTPYTPTWTNPYEDVLRVIDEHLETIKLLYPKTFDGVVQRIREL